MENQLNAVIHNINTIKYYFITVYDNNKKEHLYKLYPATEILKDFESGEKFFAHLKSKGNKNLKLTLFTKNCKRKIKQTTWLTVNLQFELRKNILNNPATQKPIEPVPLKFENEIPVGLRPNIFIYDTGLNKAQTALIAGLEHDVKKLKTENVALKEEIQKMELRNIQTLQNSNNRVYEAKKKHSNVKFANSLLSVIIVNLPDIIDCFKQVSQNRLNAPANLNYGSEVKNRFSKFILTIDDKALLFIMSIMNILKTNKSFESELYQLIKKYNIY